MTDKSHQNSKSPKPARPEVQSSLSPLIVTTIIGLAAIGLPACQPLYLENEVSNLSSASNSLAGVAVKEVNSRTGQQVRNHLIFLLNGGQTPISPSYETELTVTATDRKFSAQPKKGVTSGTITITASYNLRRFDADKTFASGSRFASANYELSSGFSAARAKRDAQNRAAKKVAEQLRLSIAADLKKQ